MESAAKLRVWTLRGNSSNRLWALQLFDYKNPQLFDRLSGPIFTHSTHQSSNTDQKLLVPEASFFFLLASFSLKFGKLKKKQEIKLINRRCLVMTYQERINNPPPLMFGFLFCALAMLLLLGSADAQQFLNGNVFKKGKSESTVVFPVGGGVYPQGYLYAIVNIGQPPKPFYLDIDTGSDLTWVQCDAPCVHCVKAPHAPYKPSMPKQSIVFCKDPICPFVPHPPNHPCVNPEDQCDYQIDYADSGSSLGVMMNDSFQLQLADRSLLAQSLKFGCGYDQEMPRSTHAPFVDGILGLANGQSSILSQLKDEGVTRNIVGHCFSSKGGGYLFLGDAHLSSAIVWVPLLHSTAGNYYNVGPAELQFDGKTVVSNGKFTFDSGSTYTYLNNGAYKSTISMLKSKVDPKNLKEAPEDKTLPVCWKGTKRFNSINDVKSFFRPLAIRFKNPKNAVLELLPEHYLIINEKGNVCLAILDGSAAHLGDNNLIGDVSMQNRVVIYDNEKQQIGWSSENCDKAPKF